MSATTIAHQATMQGSSTDFLSFLKETFDEEEAHNFFTSFALTLQGKNDEFCIDLDEAYGWLGYKQKGKAVALLRKLNLKQDDEFSFSQFNRENGMKQ